MKVHILTRHPERGKMPGEFKFLEYETTPVDEKSHIPQTRYHQIQMIRIQRQTFDEACLSYSDCYHIDIYRECMYRPATDSRAGLER